MIRRSIATLLLVLWPGTLLQVQAQRATFFAQNVAATAVAAPVIRGTGMAFNYASTFSVAWPSGSQAGDLCVIGYGGAYQLSSTPTGWTLYGQQTGSNFNGSVIAKVLTSGDISTGSVSITVGGAFAGITVAVDYIGPTGGIREVDSIRGSASPITVTTSGGVLSTDGGFYFGAQRGSGSSGGAGPVTASRGTQVQQANDNYYVSAVGNVETLATGGSYSVIFTDTPYEGFNNYQAVVIVKGI